MGMSLMGSSASTAEIESSAEELDGILHEIELGLQEMALIDDMSARQSKAKNLSEKMTRARNMQHSMKVELQDLDDRDKKFYDAKVKEFTPRISALQEEIKRAKNSTNKADLVLGASPTSRDTSQMSDSQMLDHAQSIQQDDKKAARRMLKMVTNTEEIAANTMETMQGQTDQLARIHQDLEEMDDTLKLASAQIRKFLRKQATDKVIMAFLFMIIIGIVVALVLHVAGVIGDDKMNIPEAAKVAGIRRLHAVFSSIDSLGGHPYPYSQPGYIL